MANKLHRPLRAVWRPPNSPLEITKTLPARGVFFIQEHTPAIATAMISVCRTTGIWSGLV